VLLKKENIEFKLTGLKVDAFIRISKIATLSKKLIVGELGEIGPKLKKEVNRKIIETLKI